MSINKTSNILLEIRTYKGRVGTSWKAPTNKRRLLLCIRGLLRFAARVEESRIFVGDVIPAIQEAARALADMAGIYLLKDSYAQHLEGLKWVLSEEFSDLAKKQGAVVEKVRERKSASDGIRCSLCRVRLVWPAYAVDRDEGLHILGVSSAIGILCLGNRIGKLRDLTAAIRVETEKISALGKDASGKETSSNEAALAPLAAPVLQVPAACLSQQLSLL